jgi:replicative DNA helicase Mcm
MISEGEAVQALSKFFKDRWYDQVEDFALQYPDSTAFDVDYWALRNYNRELEDLIENEPHKLFKCVPLALNLIEHPIDVKFTNATIRICGFPIKTAIRDIRNKHIHKFIKVEGLIRRASDVKPKDAIVAFECMRCGHVTYIPQPSNKVVEPFECESQTCGKKGPFKRDFQLSTFDDFQILEVQESPDPLRDQIRARH